MTYEGVQPGTDEIRVRSGRRELVATGTTLTIGDAVFDLNRIDRVIYKAAIRINQASYTIGVAAGDEKNVFMVDAYRRGTEFTDVRDAWNRLVSLLEATACPRLARAALASIRRGETVTFGAPPANRIDADTAGVRPRRPFARVTPWSAVADVRLLEGQVQLFTAAELAAGKAAKLRIDMSGWNAVLLPRVAAAFIGRA
jgi:hypothetical protein